MTTYVLVGGAWLGGWCWQNVARQLRDNGHDSYSATLTGLGERVHLASPQVDLETHITDVVIELPTGHYPMFSRPDDLAEVLLDLPLEKPVQNDAGESSREPA